MTQAELAVLANSTPSALNKVEMGRRGLDQRWMRLLAPLLGVTPAELLPDEDNAWRPSDEEREMLERFRAATETERQTFRKVSDAILPSADEKDRAA